MLNKNTVYLGEFMEERDGAKVAVQKWELVVPVIEHNAQLDAVIARAEEKKINENTPLGKIDAGVDIK